MVLPFVLGRCNVQMTSSVEADAAILSGAATAQAEMNEVTDSCLPFNGAHWLPSMAAWQRIFDRTVVGPVTRTIYKPLVNIPWTNYSIECRKSWAFVQETFLAACDFH